MSLILVTSPQAPAALPIEVPAAAEIILFARVPSVVGGGAILIPASDTVLGASSPTVKAGAASSIPAARAFDITAGVPTVGQVGTVGQVSYVGAGVRAIALNAAVTPPLPSGWQTGDLFIAGGLFSSPAGSVTTPAGWTPRYTLGNADGDLYIYTRIAQAGDTDPTFNVSGGSSGDGIVFGIMAFRGIDPDIPLVSPGIDTINIIQQNIPVNAPSAAGITNGAVVFVGARNAGYAATNTLSGDGLSWVEAWDFSNGGNGTHLCADIAVWIGNPPTLTNKTFVLSSTTGTSYGKSFIVAPVPQAPPTGIAVPAATMVFGANVPSITITTGSGYIYQSADVDLIAAGRRILDYMWGLRNRTDKKVISGQSYLSNCNTVYSESGYFPGYTAETCLDFFSGTYPNDSGATVRQDLLTMWQGGGIPGLLLGTWNPKTHGTFQSAASRDFTQADMVSVVTPGHAYNTDLNTQLDMVIVHLLWLQSNSVPIILRLYPEYAQNSFWWSARGASVSENTAFQPLYKNLWMYTVNYLKTHGVHNCMYLAATTDWEGNFKPANFSVGCLPTPINQWVDIVGSDKYKDLFDTTTWVSSDLATQHQMEDGASDRISIFPEYGQKLAASATHTDSRKVWVAIKTYAPKTSMFMNWGSSWSLTNANNDFNRQTLADPWCVNRADLPDFKTAPAPTTIIDGITRTLSWSDDFDGTTLNSNNWNIIEFGVNWWGGGTFRQDTLSVSGGALHLPIRYIGGNWYQSGVVSYNEVTHALHKKFDPMQGVYIEIRCKMPKGDLPVGGGTTTGIWSAGWMMPAVGTGEVDYYYDNGGGNFTYWPNGGELDLWETQFSTTWAPSYTNTHMVWSGPIFAVNSTGDWTQIKRFWTSNQAGIADWETDWHTFGFHWWHDGTTIQQRYRIDGTQILSCFGNNSTSDTPVNSDLWDQNAAVGQWSRLNRQAGAHGTGVQGSPFDRGFYLILNSSVRGGGPINQDVTVNPSNDGKELTIDYVRAYV